LSQSSIFLWNHQSAQASFLERTQALLGPTRLLIDDHCVGRDHLLSDLANLVDDRLKIHVTFLLAKLTITMHDQQT
jgi:hypothetical protein